MLRKMRPSLLAPVARTVIKTEIFFPNCFLISSAVKNSAVVELHSLARRLALRQKAGSQHAQRHLLADGGDVAGLVVDLQGNERVFLAPVDGDPAELLPWFMVATRWRLTPACASAATLRSVRSRSDRRADSRYRRPSRKARRDDDRR